MIDAAYQKRLEKNIVKYSWYKIFTKRVFLPLITIQLVTVGQVTLEQLAIIAIVTSLVQALLQMPGGYVADKIGNRKSIILGASISVVSPLFYAFMPNFWGGLIASILFFGGYVFQTGAVEAFMHNTLIALGREKQYSKVMGRAQTYGLIGNVVLIALIPLTYSIHHTLPFIIGFISLVGMLLLTISFVHPVDEVARKTPKNPFDAMRKIVTPENVALFVFAGFLAGVAHKGGEFRELLFLDIGIAVGLFGFILAASSVVGAAMGWYIHILDKLKPLSFYLTDLVIISVLLILGGATNNQWVAIGAFILFAGYTRVRTIIFQSKMLNDVQHTYKATLISALNVFNIIGEVIAITILTYFVTQNGYLTGYILFGLAIFGIGLVLWLVVLMESRWRLAKKI